MTNQTRTDPVWNGLSHVLLREPKDREQLTELLHDAKERKLLNREALGDDCRCY
ncbi:hypothetical protein [Coxiella-like endosymbiont]|uniref:hypothetical protein n=1 Tax=Coxiella-like endosymbiont TaxID=1592897 RepID=UPI00272DC072|nr:hypothetical protein [Coxiella-like endosymbiont]